MTSRNALLKRLIAGVGTVALAFGLGLAFRQQEQIKRLMEEIETLRRQVQQATSQAEETERLDKLIKAREAELEAGRSELLRLRAQASRFRQVEQEYTRLNLELQHLTRQSGGPAQTGATIDQLQTLSQSAPSNPPLPPGVTDLGQVTLQDGTPMRLDLGKGRECLVTATLLTEGKLQLVFKSESRGPDGLPTFVEQTATMLPQMQAFTVINEVEVALTPVLKAR